MLYTLHMYFICLSRLCEEKEFCLFFFFLLMAVFSSVVVDTQ